MRAGDSFPAADVWPAAWTDLPRQAAALRHRQGRRRQVDRRRRARAGRRAARAADDRLRGRQQERMSRAFGVQGVGYHEVELAPGLFAFSIDPSARWRSTCASSIRPPARRPALHEPHLHLLRRRHPGMRELVTIGKVWELAQDAAAQARRRAYDLVIVDAPATGHGAGDAARAARRSRDDRARRADQAPGAARSTRFITDRAHTGVSRSRWPRRCRSTRRSTCSDALREELGSTLDRVVVNAVLPDRFSSATRRTIAGALDDRGLAGRARRPARRAVRAPRARAQREQLARLRERLGRRPSLRLPVP